MLELRCGVPRWYRRAEYALLVLAIAAMTVTPPKAMFAGCLLALVALVAWRAQAAGQGAGRPARLYVDADQSLCLVLHDSDDRAIERAVEVQGSPWLTSRLIVLAVRAPGGSVERLLVFRDQNHVDAFRRFTVLCRFGFAEVAADRQNTFESKATGA